MRPRHNSGQGLHGIEGTKKYTTDGAKRNGGDDGHEERATKGRSDEGEE